LQSQVPEQHGVELQFSLIAAQGVGVGVAVEGSGVGVGVAVEGSGVGVGVEHEVALHTPSQQFPEQQSPGSIQLSPFA
jgi:hypothetical protein